MTLWPVLRPADWPGAEHAWCRRLLDHPDPSWVPWLAVARHDGPLVSFVGTDLEAAAIETLAAAPVEWREMGDGIAVIEGEHAAERALDPGTLWRLGESVVGSQLVALAIPRTGLLLAGPFAAAPRLAAAAAELSTGELALTTRILVATDGVLTGVVR